MLTVENIDLHYGAAQALRRVSVTAQPGRITCVLGRNGVGKSSLLRAIVGHQAISGGRIRLDGEDITMLKAHERARRGVAYVPQGREIFPLLTVRENLETGFARLPPSERAVSDELFSLFPILRSMLGRRGGDLSGGQQQQLAIARALVTQPRLLVLDEPTEGIQPSIIKDIGRAIAVASGGGAAIARTPLTGREVKLGTIPNALSQAILFGRTVREAVESRKSPIEALIGVSGGSLLFQGTVRKAAMSGLRGHTYWDVEIEGQGRFSGHLYKIWVKNENLFAWLDDQIDVMPPDLICNLNPATGDAIAGVGLGGYRLGEEVAIVGIPAHPMWRVAKGIEVFGPRHFGRDMDYVPIEELQKRRPPALQPS